MDGILSLAESVADFMDPISAGVFAALIAVAVLVINIVFRRWLSPGQMGLLWGLVLIRLLMPIGPASPFSLQHLVVSNGTETTEASDAAQAAATDALAIEGSLNGAAQNAGLRQPTIGEMAAHSSESVDWVEVLLSMLPIVWFAVGTAGLGWTMLSYWRFRRRVNCTPCSSDVRLLQLWQQCCRAAGVKRQGSVVEFVGVEQPAVMGLLHRTLLLPTHAAELSDEQLKMIMLHELAHVRRWDLVTNWALVVIRAIHWWNPIYWLAAARFRSLREQACDTFVIRQGEDHSTRDYSELLLKLAERRPSGSRWHVMVPASILGLFPSVFRNRSVRGRLKALRTAGFKPGRWHTAGVCCLVLLLAIGGLTDARTPAPEPTPMSLQSYLSARGVTVDLLRSFEVREVYAGPLVTRTYDVEKVLHRIAGNAVTADDARTKMDATLRLMFHSEVMPERNASAVSTDATGGESTSPESSFKLDGKSVAIDMDRVEDNSPAPQLIFTIEDKTLSVQAPTSLHEKLGRLLDAWAEGGLSQFSVETRFVGSNRDLASEFGISWQYVEAFSSDQEQDFPQKTKNGMPVVRAESRVDDFLPVVVATLDKNQLKTLVDAAQADPRSNVLQAPKVTIFNGQDAAIADCTQRPFVVGVTPIVGKLATAFAPKIVVIEEGTKIRMLGTPSHDLKKVHLQASINMCSVSDVTESPIKMQGELVTIQVPHVNRRMLDVASDIEHSQTLLVGCLPTEGQGSYMYFLLTTNNVSEPDQW